MSAAEPAAIPPPAAPARLGEPTGPCLARAAGLAAVAGAGVGALEGLRHLAAGAAREPGSALAFAAVAVAAHALAAAVVALPCALLARLLWRPPPHRAAPASTCAGLGAAAGVAAFALAGEGPAELALAAAGATLLALALRELLAWIPAAGRARTWWVLLALALAGQAAALAVREGGAGAKVALVAGLATAGALAACALLLSRRRTQRLAAAATALALPLLGLARLPSGAPAPRAAQPAARGSVVLVTLDTLRADHLGCYGAADARTPVLDAFAREAVLFEDAVSQSNVTGPSHATMLSGLNPVEHGVVANGVRLPPRVPLLPDVLAQRLGMRSAAFVSGFTLVDEACGFARRFQRYDDNLLAWPWMPQETLRMRLVEGLRRALERRGVPFARADRPAGETVDAALAWLEREARGGPFFLWVHLYDPHAPYEPPRELAQLHGAPWPHGEGLDWYALDTPEREALVADPAAVAHMRALYRGEISYADRELGRLLAGLERAGALDSALAIVTSDHGEGLGDHGYWFDHGTYLYDEELAVPLLVRLPGAAHGGTRVAQQVRLLDLAPTVLDWLGIAGALEASGESLLPRIADPGGAAVPAALASAELEGDLSGFPLDGRRLALRARARKLIWTSAHWLDTTRVPQRLEYYDLERDPRELRDLAAGGAPDADPLFAALRDELEAFRDLWKAVGRRGELDPALLERLRQLGY